MQLIKLMSLLLANTLALSACQSTSNNISSNNTNDNKAATTSTDAVEFFTDNGLSNPVATLQHPAGEHPRVLLI